MTIQLTIRLIKNLRRLLDNETIPYSSLPPSLSENLVREGLLEVAYRGSRRSLLAPNMDALAGALPYYNEALTDLDAAEALCSDDSSRAAQASLSGNSKTRSQRSCPGFLVNSYERLDCRLANQPFAIQPADGTAVYISDWRSFLPPVSVIIVGVENMENFLEIRRQKSLFEQYLGNDKVQLLFVSRYAFSSDLSRWLSMLPNRYLHFGDFDLAGIGIFLSEFRPFLGERGAFMIPSDIEFRISHGSRKRYDDQYQKYASLTSDDPDINNLISLIHKYRRTYDPEGYINRKRTDP